MNQNHKEDLLTRWMDDALSDEELRELEPILAAHPELQDEREEYRRLREDLRAALPSEVEPPYPDFFNAHLQRHIEGLARGEARERNGAKSGWNRLWTWWMAPAATAALVVAFVAGMYSRSADIPAPIAEATAAYSPLANVTAEAVRDDDLDATVIVLSGLEKISDDKLIGWSGSQAQASGFFVTVSNTY